MINDLKLMLNDVFDTPGYFKYYKTEYTTPSAKVTKRPVTTWTSESKCFYVRAEVPGWNQENTDVYVRDNQLCIKNFTDNTKKKSKEDVFVEISSSVVHDKYKAWFKDGVLTVGWPLSQDKTSYTIKFEG